MNETTTTNVCLIATITISLHLHLPRTFANTVEGRRILNNEIDDHYDAGMLFKNPCKLKNWEHLLLHIYEALKQMYV